MDISAAKNGRSARKGYVFPGFREDCDLPPELEEGFSRWKVLVGPKDWEHHHLGREGARRYSLHNLPSADGCHSGVYELALYLDESIHSVSTRRSLQRDALVPVYVGHAVNVRERLQAYGRSGSHLEGPLQNGSCQYCKRSFLAVVQNELKVSKKIVVQPDQGCCFFPHLFTRAFHSSYSIAYRWAYVCIKSVRNKSSVQFKHNRLGSNGKRRAKDAFRKLECICQARRWYALSKWIQKLGPSRAVNLCEERTDEESTIKCLPRLLLRNPVSKKREVTGNSTSYQLICHNEHTDHKHRTPVCESVDGSGNNSNCVQSVVRKQCESHKGPMQLVGSPALTAVLIGKHTGSNEKDISQLIDGRGILDDPPLIKKIYLFQASKVGIADQLNQEGSLSLTCGYILEDGSRCAMLPSKGRKRCAAHKGRRIKVQC